MSRDTQVALPITLLENDLGVKGRRTGNYECLTVVCREL